jgi:ribosome-associated protein
VITRLAGPEEIDGVLDVWRAARAAQGRRPSAEVVARVEEKARTGLLLVGEDDDGYAGLVLAEAGRDDPELLHLEMVIVHPSRQGQGLGGRLVEAIADLGWERGYRRAEVWCTAPGFYEACGFERSGREREDGNVHMVAHLEAPVRDVRVSGEIRLGQFLKLAELVQTGAEGKDLVAAGEVLVNDEVEPRRGRQLAPGDVVRAQDRTARVVGA